MPHRKRPGSIMQGLFSRQASSSYDTGLPEWNGRTSMGVQFNPSIELDCGVRVALLPPP